MEPVPIGLTVVLSVKVTADVGVGDSCDGLGVGGGSTGLGIGTGEVGEGVGAGSTGPEGVGTSISSRGGVIFGVGADVAHALNKNTPAMRITNNLFISATFTRFYHHNHPGGKSRRGAKPGPFTFFVQDESS